MAILKNLGDKVGAAVETQKLNAKINAEKEAIDGVSKKIGEYYYRQYKSGDKLPEEAASLCAVIDGHNKAIDDAKAEIERLKTKSETEAAPGLPPAGPEGVCPSCGKPNPPKTKFCNECGAKLPEQAAPGLPPAGPEGVCPSCGKPNPPKTKFCSECGAKLPEQAAPPKPPAAPPEGVCPSCGKPNPPGTKFCRECGARLSEQGAPPKPPAPPEGVCPSCGKPNPPGTKFCRECGAKLN